MLLKRPFLQSPWPILLIYLAVAALYFHAVPTLEGYDSIAHFNYINYLRSERQLPLINAETGVYSYELVQQPPLYYLVSALASGWLPFDGADELARQSFSPYFDAGWTVRRSVTLPDMPRSLTLAAQIARGVSLLGGLLCVLFTWLFVERVFGFRPVVSLSNMTKRHSPIQPNLITLITSTVALNPLFLYLSTTITNDAWVAAATSGVIWLVVYLQGKTKFIWWHWLLAGGLIGVATLVKYSVLVMALPLLLLWILRWRQLGARQSGLIALWVAVGWLSVAGFWYVGNLLRYGELVPTTAAAQSVNAIVRHVPWGSAEILPLIPEIIDTYWGAFERFRAPESYYLVRRLLNLLGVIGFFFAWRERKQLKLDTRLLMGAASWLLVVWASFFYWIRTIHFGEQPRLLLASAPPLALLLTLGWYWLLRKLLSEKMTFAIIQSGLVLLALWPLATLSTIYAQPSAIANLPDRARSADVVFESGMALAGVAFPQGTVIQANETMPVELFFTTDKPIDEHHTLFVHLFDEQDRLLYQFDGIPFAGRHPTRQWVPGDLFMERQEIELTDVPEETQLATLAVGFYRWDSAEARQSVYAADGTLLGDSLTIGRIRLLDTPVEPIEKQNPLATWEQGIALLDANLEADAENLQLDLEWTTDAVIRDDYTVFVHVFDADGNIIAQRDQYPQTGAAPTSSWVAGEAIRESYLIGSVVGWDSVVVGLYDADSGQRLQLLDDKDSFVVVER